MKRKEIYENFLLKIKEVLENDNFEWIDYILEYMYSSWIPDDIMDELDDILNEITLYSELKTLEYKQEALDLIKDFEDTL